MVLWVTCYDRKCSKVLQIKKDFLVTLKITMKGQKSNVKEISEDFLE